MAFPPQAATLAQQPHQTGIVLGIGLSSDRGLAVEIQRMSTGSTWATIDVLPGVALSQTNNRWLDPLPLDNRWRWYRGRNTYPGLWPSAWTTQVQVKPVVLGMQVPAPLAVTGKGIGASLHMQAPSQTVKVGTAQASTFVTKRTVYPTVGLLAGDGSTAVIYAISQGRVYATGTNFWTLWQPLVLPVGVTIRRVGIEGRRTTAGATCTAYLRNYGSNIVAVGSTVGTGYGTQYQTVTHAVSSSQSLTLELTLLNAAGSDQASARRLIVEYTMPSYDKGL